MAKQITLYVEWVQKKLTFELVKMNPSKTRCLVKSNKSSMGIFYILYRYNHHRKSWTSSATVTDLDLALEKYRRGEIHA